MESEALTLAFIRIGGRARLKGYIGLSARANGGSAYPFLLAFMDRGQKGKAVSKSDNFEAVSSQTSKN
jgi:hypothetical protein